MALTGNSMILRMADYPMVCGKNVAIHGNAKRAASTNTSINRNGITPLNSCPVVTRPSAEASTAYRFNPTGGVLAD